MEREELLQEVQGVIEADGKQLSRSLSEETINAELDDELENIGDDAEANKKVFGRLAKRLLRMDGNIHSNVSREVKEYKKNFKPAAEKREAVKDDPLKEDSEELKMLKELTARLNDIEKSRIDKEKTEAKDAAVDSIKKGLKKKFADAKIEVNDYIYRQTLRDLELPDDEKIDTDDYVKKLERAYYRNLKEAGLDKKETAKPHTGSKGGGGGASSKLDEMFKKKHPEWAKS